MKTWIAFLSLLSACLAQGPPPAAQPAFEVASIRPAQPMQAGKIRMRLDADDVMLRYSNVTLRDCIRSAYGVQEFQVQGPDWLDDERFDIVAKLPAGSSKEQVPEMLQRLLAERFKLALHRDKKEHAIYALVPAKGGPKLKAAEVPVGEAGAGTGKPAPPRGARMIMMGPEGAQLKMASSTLSNLAETISRFTERPVVDMTGVKGEYDFDLAFAPETMRRMPGGGRMAMGPTGGGERMAPEPPAGGGGTIYDAVQRYGLKLEPRKAPMDVLIVDHIERKPTEN